MPSDKKKNEKNNNSSNKPDKLAKMEQKKQQMENRKKHREDRITEQKKKLKKARKGSNKRKKIKSRIEKNEKRVKRKKKKIDNKSKKIRKKKKKRGKETFKDNCDKLFSGLWDSMSGSAAILSALSLAPIIVPLIMSLLSCSRMGFQMYLHASLAWNDIKDIMIKNKILLIICFLVLIASAQIAPVVSRRGAKRHKVQQIITIIVTNFIVLFIGGGLLASSVKNKNKIHPFDVKPVAKNAVGETTFDVKPVAKNAVGEKPLDMRLHQAGPYGDDSSKVEKNPAGPSGWGWGGM